MSFVRRILSLTLVQVILEGIGVLVLTSLLTPLISLLPANSYPATILFDWLLALLIGGWFLVAGRFLERRSWTEIGLGRHRAGSDLALGFALGAGMMATIIGIMALAGWYRVTGIAPAGIIAGPLLAFFIIYCAVAVYEEIIFRGILFRLFEKMLGSWIALLLSALFFGVSHLITPHATLVDALAIAVTGGTVSAGLYLLTRNLWSVFGLHWAWNFCEGAIFGAPVSGKSSPGLLHSVTVGPAIWTGGSFGPEASLPVLLIGGGVALILLVFAVRRQCVFSPAWLRRTQPTPSAS